VQTLPNLPASLWDALANHLATAPWRPRSCGDVLHKQVRGKDGAQRYILHNPNSERVVRVGKFGKQLYELLDGSRSPQQIAIDLAKSGYLTSIDEVTDLLNSFQRQGFLARGDGSLWGSLEVALADRSLFTKVMGRLVAVLQLTLRIRQIDHAVTQLHKTVRAGFTHRGAHGLLAILGVVGFSAFIGVLHSRGLSFLPTAGSLAGGIVVMWLLQFLHGVIHELAHALTLKHFGGRIREGGVMLFMANVAFFVDTTDAWYLPGRQRMLVSAAGPCASFLVGSGSTLLALALPGGELVDVLLKMAFLAYISVFMNICPLLDLDGYYILIDHMDRPNLRQEATAWWALRFRRHRSLVPRSKQEWTYAVFGALSAIWAAFLVLASLGTWGRLMAGIP
jgi:putative peptide zinc metalloprotease protein